MKLILVTLISVIAFLATLAVTLETNEVLKECSEQGDCVSEPKNCTNKCGCDGSISYYYNSTTDECLLDIRALMNSLVQKYDHSEKIHAEAEKVFQGIFASALLIATCTCICVLSACIYCCRITYYDNKLKKDVKALAKKMGRDKMRKISTKVKTEPLAESCNVVVEDAGLFVY